MTQTPWLVLPVLLTALPALAAGDGEGDSHFVWEAINLAILVGVLVFFSRKPVTAFLKSRRSQVADNLSSSEKLLRESESRLAELKSKTENLDAELADIRRETAERAEREAAEIVAEAKATAARIERDAESAVERETLRAQQALRKEAAELAMELAADRLRGEVTDADRSRLVDEFVERVRDGAEAS